MRTRMNSRANSSASCSSGMIAGAPRGSSYWVAVEHVRRESVTGLEEEIHKEGWLLKEPGYRDSVSWYPKRFLKTALPLRRYVTLFPSRVDYFAEITVTLRVTAKDRKKRAKQLIIQEDEGHVPSLGFYVDDFNNKVVGFDGGASSAALLEVGDVITEVDGMACFVPDIVEGDNRAGPPRSKFAFSVVRRRGCIPPPRIARARA